MSPPACLYTYVNMHKHIRIRIYIALHTNTDHDPSDFFVIHPSPSPNPSHDHPNVFLANLRCGQRPVRFLFDPPLPWGATLPILFIHPPFLPLARTRRSMGTF